MWNKLRPVNLDYIQFSPNQLTFSRTTLATPEKIFEVLAGDRWHEWFKDFKGVEWQTYPPHKPGSIRTVYLKLLKVQETILAWDYGNRFSFSIDFISLPLVKAMLEDIQIQKDKNGKTLVTWTVHYELQPWVTPFHFLAKLIFGGMFRESLNGLVEFAENS